MLKTLGIVKGALLTDKQRHHLARRLQGKSVLEWVVRQMTDCERLDGVVVVAEEGPDEELVNRLTPRDVPVLSFQAKDTMSLLRQVLEKMAAESCLFIGSDWPFLDTTIIDRLVQAAQNEKGCDYAAYQFMNEIFSVGRPYGLFPEWYRSETIRNVSDSVNDQIHRQLPGTYFLDNQDKHVVELLPAPLFLDRNDIQFDCEEQEDWDYILDLHDALGMEVLDGRKLGGMLQGRRFEQRELICQ